MGTRCDEYFDTLAERGVMPSEVVFCPIWSFLQVITTCIGMNHLPRKTMVD